jgi:hypothetical protein
VRYDTGKLEPVEVKKSGLTENAVFRASVEAGGIWRVTFTEGEIAAGQGVFLTFVFKAAEVCEAEVLLEGAELRLEGGRQLGVTMPKSNAVATAASRPVDNEPGRVVPWSLGDMNGDGWITKEDTQILARLKQSSKPKWNERELLAGDFNRNGKLDNADYQALRSLLKEIEKKGGK